MLRSLITLLAAVFIHAGLFSAHAQQRNAQKMAEGAQIYNANCMRCHNARSPTERNDREWATIVAHMRARGNLTRSEAEAVLVYLRASNRPESRQQQEESARRTGPEGFRDSATGSTAGSARREMSVATGAGSSVLSIREIEELRRFLDRARKPVQDDSAKGDSPTAVVVEMVDKGGNTWRFTPADVEVSRGDTLRFVQKDVVPHNVEFRETPDDAELGEAQMGPFLTQKGETYELVIDERFSTGKYRYVCTPHVAQGMKGRFKVVHSEPPITTER